jgi:hypothetical protein
MNKEQITAEITAQISLLKQDLLKEISKQIKSELTTIAGKLNNKIDETCTKITEDNQKTVEKNNQIVLANQNTDMSLANFDEVKLTKKIETKIMKNIEHKYDAKISRVLEWNAYQQQDTDHMVTSYQKAVLNNEGKQKLLTGRGNTKHIISEQVSLAFDYGEDNY